MDNLNFFTSKLEVSNSLQKNLYAISEKKQKSKTPWPLTAFCFCIIFMNMGVIFYYLQNKNELFNPVPKPSYLESHEIFE